LRPQHFPLDPRIALLYIGACALLTGCPRPPAPLVPQPLAAMDRDSAVAWSQATLPTRYTAIRFRWKYQDDQKRWGGRGQARIAPPDSLRFDYVGPLGLGAGAAAIVADSALWADPARVFGGGSADSSVLLRRFAQDGDTLDYRETRGGARVLEAEWRREGNVLARSRTEFDARRMPVRARMDFPEESARFELTVVLVDTAAVLDPAIWRGRR